MNIMKQLTEYALAQNLEQRDHGIADEVEEDIGKLMSISANSFILKNRQLSKSLFSNILQ